MPEKPTLANNSAWLVSISIIVAIGLGIGVFIASNQRRKKKLLFSEECEQVRRKNKALLKNLKNALQQLNLAQNKKSAAWRKYKAYLRQPVLGKDGSIADLERKKEAVWEEYREDMRWSKKNKAGPKMVLNFLTK